MGAGVFIERLAAEIEADYRRWSEFEKSSRLASHSALGVIELMPTSDGRFYISSTSTAIQRIPPPVC